jgi:DNA-damage-inducible protein J
MSNVMIQARVSQTLKTQAEQLFASMGLSVSEAVRIFLQQSVNEHGLPFQPRAAKIPNAETIAAMEELDNGGGTRYKNTNEMFKSWDK